MVVRIFVVPGRIVGKVEGSRVRPYDVQISAPLLRDQPLLRMLHFLLDVPEAMQEVLDHVPQLIPNPHDVEFVCSCPDWGDPCKHGVALWLAAAERFAREPEHLLRFRGIGTDGPALRTTGSGPHDVARGGGTGEAAEAASAERTVSALLARRPACFDRLLAEGETQAMAAQLGLLSACALARSRFPLLLSWSAFTPVWAEMQPRPGTKARTIRKASQVRSQRTSVLPGAGHGYLSRVSSIT